MKHCTRCDRIKTRDEFHRWTRSMDGLQVWCKECLIAYNRARRRRPDCIKRERWRGICRRLEKKYGMHELKRVRSLRRRLYIHLVNRKKARDART